MRRRAANSAFAHLTFLATNAGADDLGWWAACYTILADLARFTTDIVTDDLSCRTAEAGGIDAGIRRLAALFIGAPDETFRTAYSDVWVETCLGLVAAGNVTTTHRAAWKSSCVATFPTCNFRHYTACNGGGATKAEACGTSDCGTGTAKYAGCSTPALT